MKSIVKKSRLLLLSLVWFLVIWVVSIAIWITIINTAPDDSEHKVRLHSLYLEGRVTDKDLIGVESGKKNLDINNWLVVGFGHNVESNVKYSSIGWGKSSTNTVGIRGWGIWWWLSNKISWNNSAIGGGASNRTNWSNSVVVWWRTNKAFSGWIVLWWQRSQTTNGVVLGWSGNKAMINSLVLGQGAEWEANSFAWNGNAELNTARIEANSWVLIWTYSPIHGVSLVVSWSVKLGSGHDGNKWAIRLNSSWCLTMYDGHTHVLGRKSKSMCGVASWCQFGGVLLQDWDAVTGYAVSYSTDCDDTVRQAQCNDWNLSPQVFPYCYKIDSDPRWVWWGWWWGGWWGWWWWGWWGWGWWWGWWGWGWWGWGWWGWGDCNLCDINWDGEINIQDVNLINDCVPGILAGNAPSYCDFNWDGGINIQDVNYLSHCAACAQNG